MQDYKQYFKGKYITIMGLGLLGRSIAYTKFLAECGANLLVTDLKSRDALLSSLKNLAQYNNIKFVFGEHRLDDFKNKDMIIKSAGVPLDSIYVEEAKKNNIPIEMDASLFAKLAPEVNIIGITGTRGKTMTSTAIYEILKSQEKFLKKKIYLGGNVRGGATLPLLSKVKKGDIVVLELDSWQLQGFGDSKISPHISVFTTFMRDHMNYYKNDEKKYFEDKANIFKYQKKGDFLIIRRDVKKLIPKDINSKLVIANKNKFKDWKLSVIGDHQRENIACAVEVAKIFNIPENKIKTIVKNFKGVEGRLQLLRKYKGINIYNDNNSTTPEATFVGLKAIGKNIVLIAGGADKGLDLKPLENGIKKYCKEVVLLPGTGTDRLKTGKAYLAKDVKDAVTKALATAKKGDAILFSPAFASFGLFQNEYDRNDQFVKIINKLK